MPALSQLQGSMQYLAANNIFNLTLKHQGFSPYACDGFTGGAAVCLGRTEFCGSGREGRSQTSSLTNSIPVARSSTTPFGTAGTGVPAGGHAMDMIGAGNILGVPFIFYVSDHDQLNDNDGTQYIDFSLLLPSNNTPNQQPQIVFGDMGGAVAVAVITQHP